MKKSILHSAMETYVPADSSKSGKYGLISHSNVKEVTGIITDSSIDGRYLNDFRKKGANVIVADAS